MSKGLTLVIFGALFAIQFVNSLPSSSFTQQNRDSTVSFINGGQKSDGSFGSLKNTFFAVSSLSGLDVSVPNKDKVCKEVNGKATDAESAYYESFVSQTLKCGAPSSSLVDLIEKSLKSSKPVEAAYGLLAFNALAANKQDELIRKADVTTAIKKLTSSVDDDGLISNIFTTGLALKALSAHTSTDKTTISTILTNAAGLIDQAEGDLALEFSKEAQASGLRVTSSYFSGLQHLAKALSQKNVLDSDQVNQITETFIQHKHAASLEDIYAVVEGLNAAKVSVPQPLVVSLSQSSISASAKGDDAAVRVRVTDIFDKVASKSKVTLVKATDAKDKSKVLVSNQDLVASSDNIVYTLSNLLSAKPEQGFYNLEFAAKADSDLYSQVKSSVQPLKIVTQVSISDVQVTVSDSTDSVDLNDGKKFTAVYPKSVDAKINAEQFQFVTVTFKVKSAAGKTVQPHQVFAHLSNAASEAVVPAVYDGKQFVASLGLEELAGQLKGSGDYKLTVTVGDASSNSLTYTVGNVHLNYTNQRHAHAVDPFAAKPEIVHQFRVDAPRPSSATAKLFTLAVLSPLVLLFIGLGSVGANLKNFPMNSGFIYAVGFQACLGAILLLFVYYWLALNMVQTLVYLSILAVPTVFFAQKALNHVAAQNKLKVA